MRRPCECGEAVKGSPFPKPGEQCNLCWHALNTPAYRVLWGVATEETGLTAAELAALKKIERGCCGDETGIPATNSPPSRSSS